MCNNIDLSAYGLNGRFAALAAGALPPARRRTGDRHARDAGAWPVGRWGRA